jgi:hypothetical protein
MAEPSCAAGGAPPAALPHQRLRLDEVFEDELDEVFELELLEEFELELLDEFDELFELLFDDEFDELFELLFDDELDEPFELLFELELLAVWNAPGMSAACTPAGASVRPVSGRAAAAAPAVAMAPATMVVARNCFFMGVSFLDRHGDRGRCRVRRPA